jgi:hypothetical protein
MVPFPARRPIRARRPRYPGDRPAPVCQGESSEFLPGRSHHRRRFAAASFPRFISTFLPILLPPVALSRPRFDIQFVETRTAR